MKSSKFSSHTCYMKHHRFLTALMSFTFFPSFLLAEVTFAKIGRPIWEPTGAFVSSLEVPQEPGLDPFENERLFFANVLGSSHVISESLGLGFLPGDTHAGPYDGEFQEAVAAWEERSRTSFRLPTCALLSGCSEA